MGRLGFWQTFAERHYPHGFEVFQGLVQRGAIYEARDGYLVRHLVGVETCYYRGTVFYLLQLDHQTWPTAVIIYSTAGVRLAQTSYPGAGALMEVIDLALAEQVADLLLKGG